MLAETYNKTVENWLSTNELLSVPKSDEQCDRMTDFLNSLLDEIGGDEAHPLFLLIETLATLIEDYESKTIPEPKTTPGQILEFLMKENHLIPKDLRKLGNDQEIAELLKGTRAFDTEQIRYLCLRFHLKADIFIQTESKTDHTNLARNCSDCSPAPADVK